MARATSQSVVLDLSNKLAKYLGEGTSRKAAEGNFRCFSFFVLSSIRATLLLYCGFCVVEVSAGSEAVASLRNSQATENVLKTRQVTTRIVGEIDGNCQKWEWKDKGKHGSKGYERIGQLSKYGC